MVDTFKYYNPPVQKEFLGFGNYTVSKNTAKKMLDIIKKGSQSPYVRKWAEYIIKDVKERDDIGQIKAIFYFVRDNVKYVRDPRGTEYLQTPIYLLKLIESGEVPNVDCDCITMLLLTLLKSIGYKVALRVVGYRKNKFSHVYGLVYLADKGWIPLDAVRKDKYVGWESKGVQIMDVEVI